MKNQELKAKFPRAPRSARLIATTQHYDIYELENGEIHARYSARPKGVIVYESRDVLALSTRSSYVAELIHKAIVA